jgi:LmbE family N-acetylglucosaminyl deacetylase
VNDSCFLAGLQKIETLENGNSQQPHRPRLLLHLIQDTYIKPDIVIDISDFMAQKLEAIRAYKTQFFVDGVNINEPQTYISNPAFMDLIIGRTREFGRSIQVDHAEGFLCKKILGVDSLFELR